MGNHSITIASRAQSGHWIRSVGGHYVIPLSRHMLSPVTLQTTNVIQQPQDETDQQIGTEKNRADDKPGSRHVYF